ncbi:hypothetical protein BJV78DRAFT_1151713 [Lactifluus subvellereus]|nr:hypothetical protein BJV78DRAFT_1151713 [Lactifluus subvellereus]
MSLPDSLRRKEGSPAMVESLEAFKKNWGIFTENSLSQLSDWSHVAERKIITICEAVRDSVPWDVTCVRTKHTVSIHSQYPYRSIQIVLRLYSSPAEVLAGFDVDAPCCAYDGDRVWSNTVDMTRRSPSYEVRLAKYSSRGFEVYIPGLKRSEIDPTIYERAVGRVQGLARLLAIEKLAIPEARSQYQQRRSVLRGRPTQNNGHVVYTRGGRRYNGDLKADAVFSGLELSDYDIVNLHIPYGLGWDARRIERLIYRTGVLGFWCNSPYNPKNKNCRLHRHSAFFGTIQECIEDCCEHCPEPRNEEEHNLQYEEDKSYVRGRIAFLEEDPGRQSISGSFNPIDEGEWSESAYVQATAKFFNAISKNDILAVTRMIEDGEDLNRRDHVGRTPLHIAIMSNSVGIANVLIDAGARMTARLPCQEDARAQRIYEEKIAEEKRRTTEAAATEDLEEAERVRMSSEDDWSSEDSDDGEHSRRVPNTTKDEAEKDTDSLQDNQEEPDVLDISIPDWDFGFTALSYAVLSGSLEVVDALLAAGADPNFAGPAKDARPFHPLTLTIYTRDEEPAGKTKIVALLLARDPNAKKVLDIPAWSGYGLVFPVVSAILAGDYATLSVLLAYGARLYLPPLPDYQGPIHLPVEVALMQRDEVISLLAALGAAVEVPIKASVNNYTPRMSLLQWTSRVVAAHLPSTTVSRNTHDSPTSPAGEPGANIGHTSPRSYLTEKTGFPLAHNEEHVLATRDYYARAEWILRAHGAVLPGEPQTVGISTVQTPGGPVTPQESGYIRHTNFTFTFTVLYDELYEACWTGDNASIQELCLPKDIKEGKEPIQISVQTTALHDSFAYLTGMLTNILEVELFDTSVVGWTPLLVALHCRHWETARLVLTIATAQYQPPEAQGPSFDATTSSAILEGDSDEESYDSDEEDEFREQKEINFTDIAARPSAVRTEVPARKMLEVCSVLLSADGKRIFCHPLQKAIIEDDFEAFICALDLYESAGVALGPNAGLYQLVMTLDRPDMLDELIRRSGVGIPIPSNVSKSPDANAKKDVEERVYLGLKVGGKRPTDIVQQKQTRHKPITYNYDLLRGAIASGATKVVEYLAGPRPLAAHAHHAVTHSDDMAQYLKSIDNLEAALPDLLGWQVDELNESPLLCAVINDRLDILKQLFALKPNLMEEALHQRTKFIGFNALLAAAYYCSSTEMVDFLLEKGCDPGERDVRGTFAASDVGSKARAHYDYTAILNSGIDPAIVLLKDADGSTPLHVAVQSANTDLVEVLIHHGPAELLYSENSVGQTPLDVAGLKNLPRWTGTLEARRPNEPQTTPEQQLTSLQCTAPFDVEKQKVEIPKLRATLDMLFSDGHLVHGTKLATELLTFADHMERKLAIEVVRKSAAGKDVKEAEVDPAAPQGTAARTYAVLRDAAAARPGPRQLVHLADAQKSVQRNLAQQAETSFVSWSQRLRANNEKSTEADPTELHIQLKARSLFKVGHSDQILVGYKDRIDLFGEDKF